ncbi:hypothetical protein CF319_g7482 [Tilletia indica]|nr:hypothetical protein CF319_g7482 [Tilletia indica]
MLSTRSRAFPRSGTGAQTGFGMQTIDPRLLQASVSDEEDEPDLEPPSIPSTPELEPPPPFFNDETPPRSIQPKDTPQKNQSRSRLPQSSSSQQATPTLPKPKTAAADPQESDGSDNWLDDIEDQPFSKTYPSFPDGYQLFKFHLSECEDFGEGRDWVWRNKGKETVSNDVFGAGNTQRFSCLGVLWCSRCDRSFRVPADGSKKRMAEWISRGCPVCKKRPAEPDVPGDAEAPNESENQPAGSTKPEATATRSSRRDDAAGLRSSASSDASPSLRLETDIKSESTSKPSQVPVPLPSDSPPLGHKLVHQTCKARLLLTRFPKADIGIFEHLAKHAHGRPDVRRPKPSEIGHLKELVMANPHSKAKGLSLGLVKAGSGSLIRVPPARSISSTFLNLGRLAYHRINILQEGGIRPIDGSRDGPILAFLGMQMGEATTGGVAVRVADFTTGCMHIIVQTDWQRSVFLDRGGAFSGAGIGHSGVLTDVTYSVFQEFYLCGSSVFSPRLGRWVPILWTVLRRQREMDFEAHFGYLWHAIDEAGLSETEAYELMASVVDYSQAQMNGFKASHRAWAARKRNLGTLSESALQAEYKDLDAKAQKLLKGCAFHFIQSSERLRKNGSFVPVDEQEPFRSIVKALRTCRTENSFYSNLKRFNDQFPKCAEWVQWWIRCDIQSLVFPALKVMDQERWDSLPTTTSALESQHALYYLTFERKMDIINGLHCLQSLAELLEAEHDAEEEGIKTRYGEQRDNLKVMKARKARYFNDGRAPDVAPQKQPKTTPAGNPKTKDEESDSKASASAPVAAAAAARSTTRTTTTIPDTRATIGTPSQTQLQSYPHADNTCYITSVLECLWAVWLRCRDDWLQMQPSFAPGGGIAAVTSSMLQREAAYKLKTTRAVYNGLTKARNLVSDWVVEKEKLWEKGVFGGWEWFVQAVAREPEMTVQTFFSIGTQTKCTCTYGHGIHTVPKLQASVLLSWRHNIADDFAESLRRMLLGSEVGKCQARLPDGLGSCGATTTIAEAVFNFPRVLIVDLGAQISEESLWTASPTVDLGHATYQLVGRTCATTEAGTHFKAITHLSAHASISMPRPSGVYM